MNILQLVPRLETGGVERGTVDLSAELVRQKHSSIVISGGGALVRQLEAQGGVHFKLPVFKKSVYTALTLLPKVCEIIRKEKIDIVHARSRVPAWIGFFAARRCNVPFVTTCHGYYSVHFFSRVMGWGKRVIVISDKIGRHMLDSFKVPADRVRLVYRGVDLQDFTFRGFYVRKPRPRPVIGIVGRITPIKGHIHLLRALPELVKKFPDLLLLVAGGAPVDRRHHLEELEAYVANNGLRNNVRFLGNIVDVPEVMKKLDVLIMPSTGEEGFGRVICEAGAVGVPVVATAVGGVTEIIETEKSGLLIEAGDSKSLADAVCRLLDSPELSEKCAANLRKRVEQDFSLDRMTQKTLNVYNEIIREKRILVIKLAAFGDVVLAIPSLRALRRKFPGAQIDVLTMKPYRELLQKCPYINNLFHLKSKKFRHVLPVLRKLRNRGYDISVDLQNNRISHFIAFAAGIPERLGYIKKWGFFLNKGIFDNVTGLAPVDHQYRVLKPLGAEKPDARPELWLSRHHREYAEELITRNWVGKGQLLIGLQARGSGRWRTKAWPDENYARLADALAKQVNARVVFTGTRADWPAVEEIAAKTSCRPINACGLTSPMQLAALIEKCGVFVTTDSAPLHLAAAVKTPFVALFGPTDPKRHLPSAEKFALIWKGLPCSPCYSTRCYHRSCMKEITVDEVYAAIMNLLPIKT